MSSDRKRSAFAALLWLLFLIAAAAVIAVKLPHAEISGNILEMLPQTAEKTASERFAESILETEAVIAVKGGEKAAVFAEKRLKDLPQIETGLFRSGETERAFLAAVFRYPAAFVSESVSERMADPKRYAAWVNAQRYSLAAAPSDRELSRDPLLIARQAILSESRRITSENGRFTGKNADGESRSLFFITLKKGLSEKDREAFAEETVRLKKELPEAVPGAELSFAGAVFHSGAAKKRAEGDLLKLGSASAVLLSLLFFLAFRSAAPAGLFFVSAAAGTAAGLAAELAAFGSIHAVTLVMCVSLIGISADYTLYFMSAARSRKPGTSAADAVKELTPTLRHAALTTALAYAALILSPLPGLRQMAVFAAAGLPAACLTVIYWFPYLGSGIKAEPLPFKEKTERFLAAVRGKRWVPLVTAALLIWSAAGFVRGAADDSLSKLQQTPAALAADEKVISEMLHRDFSQKWVLLQEESEEKLLSRSAQLKKFLKERGESEAASLLPPVASAEEQKITLFRMGEARERTARLLSGEGVRVSAASDGTTVLTLSQFLASDAGRPYRHTVSLEPGRAELFLPAGSLKAETAEALPQAGFTVTSRRAELEAVLGAYRRAVTWTAAAVFCCLFFFFLFRFGKKAGAAAASGLGLSLLAAAAAPGVFGLPFNIFSSFALILVLGIGIDYSAVFLTMKRSAEVMLFSAGTALLSTLMSLGILVFSSTEAVQNFGLVLACGVTAAFLTAPFVLKAKGK